MRFDLLDVPVNSSISPDGLEASDAWYRCCHSSLLQNGVFNVGASLVVRAVRHTSFVMMEAPMKVMYTAVILGVSFVLLAAVKSYKVHTDDDDDEDKAPDHHEAVPDKAAADENPLKVVEEEKEEEDEYVLHPFAFMAFGRTKDHTILAQFEGPDVEDKARAIHDFKETFEKLMKAAHQGKLKGGTRNKMNMKLDDDQNKDKEHSTKIYYYLDDESKFMTALLVVDPYYADKFAYSCLNEFMGAAHEMTRNYEADTCGENGLDQLMDTTMRELFSKFKEPEARTAYGKTLGKMTMVKSELENAATTVAETGHALDSLEESTSSMDKLSKEFNKHAETAKWKHQMERYKMYITYGTIAFDVTSLSILWLVL